VIYLPDQEGSWIPDHERWRHVQFDYHKKPIVDFTWEREWRCRNGFELSPRRYYVLVWTDAEAMELQKSQLAVTPLNVIALRNLGAIL
jgi:hypothetical protein